MSIKQEQADRLKSLASIQKDHYSIKQTVK